MKLFADTASLPKIEYCFSRGVSDGITTNPKIIEATGDLSLGFEQACRRILEKYPQVPVSLETDLRGIPVSELEERAEETAEVLIEQAKTIASWGENVVVKIPVCAGGLIAVHELGQRGIKTNVTACMTSYQAIHAARAGADYVSLFANRMLDVHILRLAGNSLEEVLKNPRWKAIVEENKNGFFEEAWGRVLGQIALVSDKFEGRGSQLIVGSIRTPEDIYRIAKAQPQVITIPAGIIRKLENIPEIKKPMPRVSFCNAEFGGYLRHPMTDYTLAEFEKAADAYRK